VTLHDGLGGMSYDLRIATRERPSPGRSRTRASTSSSAGCSGRGCRPWASSPAHPLPQELTYRYHPAHIEGEDGTISSDHARPEDQAPTIPPLG
jgi:hypothetical protein